MKFLFFYRRPAWKKAWPKNTHGWMAKHFLGTSSLKEIENDVRGIKDVIQLDETP
jgi:hypothetical protein